MLAVLVNGMTAVLKTSASGMNIGQENMELWRLKNEVQLYDYGVPKKNGTC